MRYFDRYLAIWKNSPSYQFIPLVCSLWVSLYRKHKYIIIIIIIIIIMLLITYMQGI